jgi:predicted acetyltransferase
VELVAPAPEYLPSYVAALRQGWAADTTGTRTAEHELHDIDTDADEYLARLNARDGSGPPIALPDGTTVPRLPGFRMWMWDGEFSGSIGLRWQPGTAELPETCLGHCGYSVVPWKRRRGYATEALRRLLPLAREVGLPYVELTTAPDNVASQRVIVANGGQLVERFVEPAALGGEPALRFRIALD